MEAIKIILSLIDNKRLDDYIKTAPFRTVSGGKVFRFGKYFVSEELIMMVKTHPDYYRKFLK